MSELVSRVWVLAGCLWLGSACGHEGPPAGDGGTGVSSGDLTVRLTSTQPIPGFTVNIQDVYGGHGLASQVVELESGESPTGSYRYGEATFELPSGRYVVVALPLTGPGAPFGTCGAVEEFAMVSASETTEIELTSLCTKPASEGAPGAAR